MESREIRNKMELFEKVVVDVTRDILGEEKSLAFASGCLAGMALIGRGNQGDDEVDMLPEAQKREMLLGQIRFMLLEKSTEMLEAVADTLRGHRETKTATLLNIE